MTGNPNQVGEGSQIILRGAFNPAIFHPMWFAHVGLLSMEEAESAQIGIIHTQIVDFVTATFRLRVTPDLFDLTAAGTPFAEVARDVALGTFKLLAHTPVTMLGINSFAHFQAQSDEAWHRVGNVLAPKAFWQTTLGQPGMQSLTIRGLRDDDRQGWVDVRVEPSELVKPNGIFVLVNDHVQLAAAVTEGSAQELMGALDERWAAAVKLASVVLHSVRDLADGT